jgi:hypothetical protein
MKPKPKGKAAAAAAAMARVAAAAAAVESGGVVVTMPTVDVDRSKYCRGQPTQSQDSDSIMASSSTATTTSSKVVREVVLGKKTREDHLGGSSDRRDEAGPCLNAEQQRVIDLVTKGRNVFYTGCAGTGKSLVLRELIKQLLDKKEYNGKVFVTAPTGMAACNVAGQTLHSFAGFGLSGPDEAPLAAAKRANSNPTAKKRWKLCKVLIVDEISMVDGKVHSPNKLNLCLLCFVNWRNVRVCNNV